MKFTTKNITFVRWGGLSPIKQKGHKKMNEYEKGSKIFELGYHLPPARKGVYAFVWPFIDESFLIYHSEKHKNPNNHMYTKEGKLQKPRKFKYTGEVWHHLENFLKDKNQVISRRGSWVKTYMEDFIFALNKAIHATLKDLMKDNRYRVGFTKGETPNIFHKVSMLDLELVGVASEVFIDGKI